MHGYQDKMVVCSHLSAYIFTPFHPVRHNFEKNGCTRERVQSSRLPSNQQKCVDTLEGRSTHFAASPQCKVSTWDSSTGTVPEFWFENLKKGAFTLVPIDPGSTVHEHRSEGNRLLTRTKYEHNLSYLSLPVRGEWKPWFVHS